MTLRLVKQLARQSSPHILNRKKQLATTWLQAKAKMTTVKALRNNILGAWSLWSSRQEVWTRKSAMIPTRMMRHNCVQLSTVEDLKKWSIPGRTDWRLVSETQRKKELRQPANGVFSHRQVVRGMDAFAVEQSLVQWWFVGKRNPWRKILGGKDRKKMTAVISDWENKERQRKKETSITSWNEIEEKVERKIATSNQVSEDDEQRQRIY